MGKTKDRDKDKNKGCNTCEFYTENRNLRKHVKSLQREIQRLMSTIRALNKDGKNLKELEDEVDQAMQAPDDPGIKCHECGSFRVDVTEISFRGGKRILSVCRDCGKRKTTKA